MTAPPTGTYESYSLKGDVESFSDIIYNVAPFDTPFINSIPSDEEVIAKLHTWQIDSLAAAVATNYHEEGLDATGESATASTELSNTCQISRKVPRVSGTTQATARHGGGNELDYQIAKRAKELKRDMEASALANNIEVTGSSGVARETAGIQAWLTSNLNEASDASTSTGLGDDARTAGTARAFTEAFLKDALKQCWESGGNPDLVIVDGFNKQKFSTFTGNATRNVEANEEKLFASIDVYKSDYGELQVVPNRSASNSGSAFILQRDMAAIGYLREFQMFEISKTGDSEIVEILAEWCLVIRNEAALGAVYDLTVA